MSDFRKVCPQCQKVFQEQDALEILTECPEDGAVLDFEVIDPLVGTLLADRYQVQSFIGRGATSTVYQAVDIEERMNAAGKSSALEASGAESTIVADQQAAGTDSSVAIKVLHPHLSGDAAVVKRLSQEAKSLRDFKHKNVVGVQSMGVTRQGQPFLVMELVSGQSLLEHLRQNGALNKFACLSIFDQLLDAIGAAHNRGILHRDLKPGNIMLASREDGGFFVKILDFGIAKIIPMQGDTFFRLTQTGEMMGSLLYMSPEQCLEQDWDQRGDIYSLGCVFYEALTARAPLIGRTAFETMNKHLSEMPPPLSVVRPDIQFAPGMEYIINKMLAKNPQERYQTAAEVRADLSQVSEGKNPVYALDYKRPRTCGTYQLYQANGQKAGREEVEKVVGTSDQYVRSDILAEKLRQFSRQRMFEICIFLVLTAIWAVPLLMAFASTPNALIAACLFGVLLPFLAAVAAMVVVRIPRIRTFNGSVTATGMSPLAFLNPLNSEVRARQGGADGSLLLGSENGVMSWAFGAGAKRMIEPFQRVQTLPLLLLGKEGTGKTRLLASLASNDLEDARRAQMILSPDGKLSDLIARWIAAHPQGSVMARRVLLLDLDHEISNGFGVDDSVQTALDVSERIVEAMQDVENAGFKEVLTSEQAYVLQSSISLLLSADEDLTNLPAFLTQESKRQEIFKKLTQGHVSSNGKDPLMPMRKLIEERSAGDWENLTKPLLSICYRFPLESDVALLRLFWQKASLLHEVVAKKRVMIVKGSKAPCGLFFRLVFNEILKERRPSARLSDAEGCPVVYIDDVDSCGIADKFAQILGTPTEIGLEFLLSTETLADFSSDEAAKILTEVGALAVFAISDADAQMIKPLYESSFRSKSNGLLGSLESDIYSLAHSRSLLGLLESNSMPRSDNLESHQGMSPTLFKGLNPMVFYYLSKTPGAKPKRLLAPLFQEIRITEVEWSIVESMRTGWIFNL